MAALVAFSSNFNLTTGAYWHLQFRKPGGLFMTAHLKKCPREGIFAMNSKHNELSRSHLPQINFPHTIWEESKTKHQISTTEDDSQDLITWNEDQNDNSNESSNPTSQKTEKCALCRVHNVKCQAGWSTSWNQDCWENYRQPHTCRWYHSNGQKWRETREPLNEGERGELKKLKT